MGLRYRFGEFELNPAARELLRGGDRVSLRPRSLECLVYLIEHRDRAVGRDELVAAVWGKVDVGDTVVAQTLLRARKALDDTGSQQGMIRTLPRFGYQWVAPVQELTASADAANPPPQADEAGAVVSPGSAEVASGGEPMPDVAQAEAPPAPVEAGVERTASLRVEKHRLSRNRVLAGVLLLAVAGIVAFLSYLGVGRARLQASTKDAILVMPVAVFPMDSENAWVRLGGMDYMAARLRGSGLNVLPSEQALRLASAVEGDPPAGTREKLLALSGARWIALPEMRRLQGGWSVHMRVLDAGREQVLDARGETALLAAAAAADAWLRQLGEQGRAGPPPGPLAERLHRIDAEILGGRLVEARRLLRSSSPAERSDARFLLREGKLEFRAANFDVALRSFQSALDRAPHGDIETRIGALLGLASVARARNDVDVSELRYTQALTLLESLPADRVNSRMLGIAYQGRGISRAQRGDIEAGVKDMGQARVWLQRSGDVISLGTIGHNLGKADALRGDYLQALREFDRSIDTFARFRVSDYLANSLREKAAVQLILARPGEADATIRRAVGLLPKLEDSGLATEVLLTQAGIQIARGQLREAHAALAEARTRGAVDADPAVLELRLRWLSAGGEVGQARLLAEHHLPGSGGGKSISDGVLLAAVQAALRGHDIPLAKAWLRAVATPGAQGEGPSAFSVALAGGLIDRASGAPTAALAQADRAAQLAGPRASPDSEIQTGVLRTMALLDTHQYGAASAIMGELEKYAESDYRVAWVMPRLYQALGDKQAAAAAQGRAVGLGGERDVALEPLL
jgi:DNA-binding winged helix-turn-helix (wHTH) protein/tetratricopeptide (TPR) repeat protein